MPPLADLMTLAAAVLAASVVHGAVGFGSAPVLAPVALLVLTPAVGVGVVLLVGTVLSVLVVAGAHRRRPAPVRELGALWAGVAPGALAGALALDAVQPVALRVVLASVLLVAAAAALAGAQRVGLPASALRGRAAPAVGAALGAIGALTGVIGPLAALLLVRAVPAARHREAASATVAVAGTCGLLAHVAVAGSGAVVTAAAVTALVAPALLAGLLAGGVVAARLGDAGRRRGALAGVLGGAVVALVSVPFA